MKKKLGKLLITIAMLIQIIPSSFVEAIANDTAAISNAYVTLKTENEVLGSYEKGSTEIPDEGVGKLNVIISENQIVKEEKTLTYPMGTNPGKATVTALDGYTINSLTLQDQPYKNTDITFHSEAGDLVRTLRIDVISNKASLNIQYVDMDGNKIADDNKVDGKLHEKVSVTKHIEGYTLAKNQALEVVLEKANDNLILKYTKNEVKKGNAEDRKAAETKSEKVAKPVVNTGNKAYFYILKPGEKLDSSTDMNKKWYNAGIGAVNLKSPSSYLEIPYFIKKIM